MATEVWIVSSGDYEEHSIDAVYSSLDAAVAGIKAGCSAVKWGEPEPLPGSSKILTLTAEVKMWGGRGSLTEKRYWDIVRWEVKPHIANLICRLRLLVTG